MIAFNPRESVKHSYKNFHAKGLDYICLRRSPELTTKLYLFQGDVSHLPEVVNPHDHRYRFRTLVLAGALRNAVYERTDYGTVFNEFEWRTPLNGGQGFQWKQETTLKITDMVSLFPGQEYTMEHDGIHTIKVLEDQTALLLDQFADDVPVSAATSTFAVGREPPSLDGLYERFTELEIIERINNLQRNKDYGISFL